MISKLAYVHPDAKIGNNVTIEPFASVYGNVVIGDNCWIGPNSVIMDYSRIGNNTKIFPNIKCSAFKSLLNLRIEGAFRLSKQSVKFHVVFLIILFL